MAADEQKVTTCKNGSRKTLTYEQVCRLANVVDSKLAVPGRGNYPTLNLSVRRLILAVRQRLEEDGIGVVDVRINGGGASYIVVGGSDGDQVYNDLDIIFRLDESSECSQERSSQQYDLDKVKDSALQALLDFLPLEVNRERLGPAILSDAYLQKMVKIDGYRSGFPGSDRWSLMSLGNNVGCSVEMKFVAAMRRQYEFSIDSFQVIVDGFLHFGSIVPSPLEVDECFYPTVIAESAYGDFSGAVEHANRYLIATSNPEEVRGGGLLKYCGLVARDYRPADDFDAPTLERYMCSRFFIDFPDAGRQRAQVENYLANHFTGSWSRLRTKWLTVVHAVVSRSARCLAGHRRKETLAVIDQMITLERRPPPVWTVSQKLPDCSRSEEHSSGNEDSWSNSGKCFHVPSITAAQPDQAESGCQVDNRLPVHCETSLPSSFPVGPYGFGPYVTAPHPGSFFVPFFAYPVYYNLPPVVPAFVQRS